MHSECWEHHWGRRHQRLTLEVWINECWIHPITKDHRTANIGSGANWGRYLAEESLKNVPVVNLTIWVASYYKWQANTAILEPRTAAQFRPFRFSFNSIRPYLCIILTMARKRKKPWAGPGPHVGARVLMALWVKKGRKDIIYLCCSQRL